MASSAQTWEKLLRQCLLRRTNASEFKGLAKLLLERHPLAKAPLVEIVIQARSVANVIWDPLIPRYMTALRTLGAVHVPEILTVLLKHSTITDSHGPSSPDGSATKKGKVDTLMSDTRIIQDAITAINIGGAPTTITEAIAIFKAITDWMSALVSWDTCNGDNGNQSGGLVNSLDAISVFESVGILLVALVGAEKVVEALSMVMTQNAKNSLGRALSSYVSLCEGISVPLRNRLDAFQKEFGLYDNHDSKPLADTMIDGVNVSTLQFESNVMDGPTVNSRAGLYIYINALLVGRPLIDDNSMINYLNIRYNGHHMVLVEELITAAFDVLSNAMYRNESHRTMVLFRSFLVNKLPSFFADMSATSMTTIPMELCISRALSRVDPNAFPSFSQMFSMQGSSVLSDVRQEFLFACALHKLIPESSIERLLGENPMQTLPVGGRYVKEDLVMQMNATPERAEQLIGEIESMEGNAGAIASAISEMIRELCSRKETITLKTICNSLCRRPQSLDIMLLFQGATAILQPLCSLLDAWKWDEEMGESQPVYDEFGSILLLVLAFKYRYDLTYHDLGISNVNDSFIVKLLEQGYTSQKLEDLTESQSRNLGAWITSLFIAEGISDESMSSCSPQEFYLLVATLFSQSLGACEAGKLEFDTLKGGFEYLLEPFLLPSLVVALSWLGNHIWESGEDPSIALKILHALVQPSSISGEAQAVHSTVLSIAARSLEDELKDVRAQNVNRKDIKQVLDALEPHFSFPRTGGCHKSELEAWTANPGGGGLVASIRSTFQSLVLWSTSPEISMTPPSYTHRQLLAGIRIQGSVRVIRALLDEVKLQTETGSGDIALDIATTLICSPSPESFSTEQTAHRPVDPSKENNPCCPILTLRDALLLQHDAIPKLAEADPLKAEIVVRLRRRVDSLTVSPPMAQQVANLDVSNIMHGIDMDNVHADDQMMLTGPENGGPAVGDAEDINNMIDAAAAATVAGVDAGGVSQGLGMNTGVDTSIDDVLNAADLGVGNPEFLDLDMDDMF